MFGLHGVRIPHFVILSEVYGVEGSLSIADGLLNICYTLRCFGFAQHDK